MATDLSVSQNEFAPKAKGAHTWRPSSVDK